MFTEKQQVCEKCGHVYQPLSSLAFVKTTISPCPNCDSSKIAIVDNKEQAEKKSKKIKSQVKSVKRGVMINKVEGGIL